MEIREVDGREVPVAAKAIEDICCLTVEVGTNGYQGGDSGHGSRTVLSFTNDVSCDLRALVTRDRESDQPREHLTSWGDSVDKIEIVLGGDQELTNFLEALRFAVKSLEFFIDEQSNPTYKPDVI